MKNFSNFFRLLWNFFSLSRVSHWSVNPWLWANQRRALKNVLEIILKPTLVGGSILSGNSNLKTTLCACSISLIGIVTTSENDPFLSFIGGSKLCQSEITISITQSLWPIGYGRLELRVFWLANDSFLGLSIRTVFFSQTTFSPSAFRLFCMVPKNWIVAGTNSLPSFSTPETPLNLRQSDSLDPTGVPFDSKRFVIAWSRSPKIRILRDRTRLRMKSWGLA